MHIYNCLSYFIEHMDSGINILFVVTMRLVFLKTKFSLLVNSLLYHSVNKPVFVYTLDLCNKIYFRTHTDHDRESDSKMMHVHIFIMHDG